jgi:hypothetical protein
MHAGASYLFAGYSANTQVHACGTTFEKLEL